MHSSYCMRHIFLYCTFNLPWFPFHRSKHKLWFLIPHNKVQKYRTTIVQDSRTPTPCLILVGHLFGSPIYHPPMDWVESPPPAWESEFPPTINFKHLLTLLPGCFLLMWDYERGSEKLMEKEETAKATDETHTQLIHDHWILAAFWRRRNIKDEFCADGSFLENFLWQFDLGKGMGVITAKPGPTHSKLLVNR